MGAGAIALAPTLALGQDPLASIRQYYYNWYIATRDYNVHVPSNNYWQVLSQSIKKKRPNAWTGENTECQYLKKFSVQFVDYNNVYQWQTDRNLFWMNIEDYAFCEELYRDHILNPPLALIGVYLYPGFVNPLCPKDIWPRNFSVFYENEFLNQLNPVRPIVDSYEIRVIHDKK